MRSLCFDEEILEHPPYPAVATSSSPCDPASSIMVNGHFEGSMGEKQTHGKESIKGGQSMTIDILPDVALLEVFRFYLDEIPEAWSTLVHVCRTWRNVAFGSPRYLGLRLYCRAGTPVRETLGVWPLLPISIKTSRYLTVSPRLPPEQWDVFAELEQNGWSGKWGVDNIVAALEHNDRICQLQLSLFSNSQFEKVWAVMQQPFPALKDLRLGPEVKGAPLVPVPVSFLGGSAPHLRTLDLNHISYPRLPTLLLSATHLVRLSLLGISRSGYISPETMLNCLSVLTRLEALVIGFRSVPRRKRPFLPPPTCTLLPVLSSIWFEGFTDYLEDLVAWIDAPVLYSLDVTFFHPIFDTPQLAQFISRAPKFKAYNHTQLCFSDSEAWVMLSQAYNRGVELKISYSSQPGEHASTLAQICRSSFPQALIHTVEHLYFLVCGPWEENIDDDEYLELLHPFTGVKALYISLEFTLSLPLALKEFAWEEETEVLPALETIFLEGSQLFPQPPGVQDAIRQVVALRLLACHPITISPWDVDDEGALMIML